MACKNQPSVFFLAEISTTLREFQSVSLNSPNSWMRSTTRSRIRPSQRHGSPLRPTRSRVCQPRPSVSHGILALAADLADVQVAVLLPIGGRRIVDRARDVRAGGQDGGQGANGVGRRRSRRVEKWKSRRGGGRGDLRSDGGGVGRPAPSAAARAATAATRGRCPRACRRRRRGRRRSPASGPRSITQSAVLITSRLCSITHHRVAQVDQPVEHVEQLGQVVEVQAGGRLVQQVERSAGVGPGKFGGQLHPLGLAAGERRGGLAERQVVEPHVAQRLQDAADLGDVLEQLAPPRRRTCPARRRSTGRGSVTASVSGL